MVKTTVVGWLLACSGRGAEALGDRRGAENGRFAVSTTLASLRHFAPQASTPDLINQQSPGAVATLSNVMSTSAGWGQPSAGARHLQSAGDPHDDNDPFGHIFRGLPSMIDGTWVAKRQGHFRFKTFSYVTARTINVLRLLHQVDEDNKDLADFGPFFLCGRDYFGWCERDSPQKRIPGQVVFTFGFRKHAPLTNSNQTIIPVPDCVFDDWAAVGIDDYEITTAQMREAGTTPPEKNVVGWVGNPKTATERVRLLELGREYPDNIEAIAMDWRPNLKGEARLSHTEGYMTLPQQVARWAYLLEIQGSGYGFRFKLLMHSGRPILMQQYPWAEFWHAHLVPWQHYVPVAENLSDLNERVEWLKRHPERAKEIGARSQAFAMANLTRPAALNTWAGAIRRSINLTANTGAR